MNDSSSAIQAMPLFSTLTETELEPIVGAASVAEFSAGEELVREGDTTTELLVLLSGSVRASTSSDTDSSETHSATKRPVVLGQLGLFRNAERQATIVTETASTVFRLSRDRFDHLLQSGQLGAYKVALALGRDLATRVCSLREGLRDLCNCCQHTTKEQDLVAFRRQLLTDWNL